MIKIKLPGEKYKDIELDIDESGIQMVSKQFYLDLPFSYGVSIENAKAKWDNAFSTLRIEIPLRKED